MRYLLPLVCVACAFAQSDLSGPWVIEVQVGADRLTTARANMKFEGGLVTGTVGEEKLEGKYNDPKIELRWVDRQGNVAANLTGVRDGDRLRGNASSPDELPYTWVAYREAARPAQPKTHEFTPTQFHRHFSAAIPPALRIHPGDTVRTWSVDAGGTDPSGKRRSLGGNPLTGPFYIEGALPGDTLVVKLNRVRLNRDWAGSGTGMVSNAVSPDYTANAKRAQGFSGRWKLDAQGGEATLAKPSEALKNFRVPVEPMLGCVAVAPRRAESYVTGDSGYYGGNMDYNRIREGTTVYLPVGQPGALLLVGDGHAAQGDGELTGDALETSMDIEFTVDVIRGRSPSMPYAEDKDSVMMIGIAGSLDDALRRATTGMARYLETEYGLNYNEASVVLGFAVKYDVADLVGTQVSIVARLPKTTLAQLSRK